MTEPIHIISLGAGVQSSTMALMAACGEITPMPVAAIFADTQAEPKSVYTWLDWLEKQLPFPVHKVTSGNLSIVSTTPKTSKKSGLDYLPSAVPVYVKNTDGRIGQSLRQCTDKHKLIPLRRAVLNISKAIGGTVTFYKSSSVWIGISRDEIYRMKESRDKRINHRWPLVEMGFNRDDCKNWMRARGFPEPPRSACSYCPYHNSSEWRRLKTNEPSAFNDAIMYEKMIQEAYALMAPRMTGIPFLHRSCKPLSEVDFSTEEERGQLNMFNNECDGMCGV